MWKWLWRMTNSASDCVLINDPKKLFRKKLYVTIPQWSETFPSMSDLSSGHNSTKCGLQLNDPIDWFKLCLNQPKINNSANTQWNQFKFGESLDAIRGYLHTKPWVIPSSGCRVIHQKPVLLLTQNGKNWRKKNCTIFKHFQFTQISLKIIQKTAN